MALIASPAASAMSILVTIAERCRDEVWPGLKCSECIEYDVRSEWYSFRC